VVVALGVPVFVCILALIEERTIVRRFLAGGTSKLGWFIATLGVSSIIEAAVVAMFGHHPVVAIPSPFPSRGLSVAGLTIDYRDIFACGVLLIVMVLLDLFYQRTWLGRGMRATAQDRDAAALVGIKPATMSQLAFGMSGIVAGVAGFAIAPLVFSDPTIGLPYSLKGFVALAIGGFGSVRGAVIGGLTLGVAEQLFDLYASSKYEVLSGLVLILIVLIARPEGLFRSSVARTV
jgi:branched-subunit amino acid ABC-type transport system permease component